MFRLLLTFGTQGSQVRILPLRPFFQKSAFSRGLADRPLAPRERLFATIFRAGPRPIWPSQGHLPRRHGLSACRLRQTMPAATGKRGRGRRRRAQAVSDCGRCSKPIARSKPSTPAVAARRGEMPSSAGCCCSSQFAAAPPKRTWAAVCRARTRSLLSSTSGS